MRIAVDIDDVLADSLPVIVDFYAKYYDQDFKMKDALKYDYLHFLGETKEEAEEKIFHFNQSEFFGAVRPFVEAQKYVSLLTKEHELIALTSRPTYIKKETTNWVRKNFPTIKDVWFNNSNTGSKGALTKQISKSDICIENNIDILIDDLLKFTNNSHESLRVFLVDRPWNQGATPVNVLRVFNWEEIARLV